MVIYDFGANKGQNIPYFLEKSEKVVAIEANPVLSNALREEFSREIEKERLFIESVAVTDKPSLRSVPFFIHNYRDELSTTLQPAPRDAHKFTKTIVKATTADKIVRFHGTPHYIKLDLEGLDMVVLRHLLSHGILPPYISVEGHHPAILGLLCGLGNYESFKIVRGPEVGVSIARTVITTLDGKTAYFRFQRDSAGPFGEDIGGPWMSARNLFELQRVEGLGWYDIHASQGPAPLELPIVRRLSTTLRAFVALSFPKTSHLFARFKTKLRLSFSK